jgi:hypothetical protein
MKLKDILQNKVLYFRDTDCEYYWSYKYIVEIDNDNVALINHGGSGSGWEPLSIEFVDEEFASAFFEARYDNSLDDFSVCKEEKLIDYTGNDLQEEDEDFGELDVIMINTNKVQELYNEFKKSIKEEQ